MDQKGLWRWTLREQECCQIIILLQLSNIYVHTCKYCVNFGILSNSEMLIVISYKLYNFYFSINEHDSIPHFSQLTGGFYGSLELDCEW